MSPEHIIEILPRDGHEMRAHDLLVKQWTDALILVTDHDNDKSFRTTKLLVDTRNLFPRQ